MSKAFIIQHTDGEYDDQETVIDAVFLLPVGNADIEKLKKRI